MIPGRIKMEKVNYIESTGMSKDQQELADWAENHVSEMLFKTQDGLDSNELLIKACIACGWESIPQTGGLIIHWN